MKYIYISIFFILNLFISNHVIADQSAIKELTYKALANKLEEGGKIIFIRHALAPGNGDPENIDLNNCDTQRNLSQEGIDQSIRIGKFFSDFNIPVDKVLSSEWCRCKDTARFAFNNYETFKGLNSFYQEKFYKYKDEQIKSLKKYISSWNSDKNLILVTHFVVISEIFNVGVSSGEMIVSDKNYKILGNIIVK